LVKGRTYTAFKIHGLVLGKISFITPEKYIVSKTGFLE
jgi:hypothetical protein